MLCVFFSAAIRLHRQDRPCRDRHKPAKRREERGAETAGIRECCSGDVHYCDLMFNYIVFCNFLITHGISGIVQDLDLQLSVFHIYAESWVFTCLDISGRSLSFYQLEVSDRNIFKPGLPLMPVVFISRSSPDCISHRASGSSPV